MTTRRKQTARRILDGAATVFAKGGYAAASMDEIAAAAGVSKLLLYRDFSGKRELYEAVLARTQQSLMSAVTEYASPATLRTVLAVARADPDGFTLLYRHAVREPEFAAYAAALSGEFQRIAAQVLAAVEPDPRLRRWAAEMTVTITLQGIIAWLEHGDPAADGAFVDRLLALTRAAARGTSLPREAPGTADATGQEETGHEETEHEETGHEETEHEESGHEETGHDGSARP